MNAAVIGMGPHGYRTVDTLQRIPAVNIAAVVDKSPQVREAVQNKYAGITTYSGAGELFATGGIDLCCVVTNSPTHADLAISAMEAGIKRILVEKPMAGSVAECDLMIQTAERLGARLSVNQSRRFDPLYMWLGEKIQSGDWGKPRAMFMQRPGIGLGCLGTHSYDVPGQITGQTLQQVIGWVDPVRGKNPRGDQFVDPGGQTIMVFEDDFRVTINQIEDGAGPSSVEIDLTRARIRICEVTPILEIIERDLSVIPGPGRPPKYYPGEYPEDLSICPDIFQMLQGALENLISDDPLICKPEYGRQALEVMTATYLSHERGNVPVDIPLKQDERERWFPVT